ncbi:hypothetical protein L1887_56474 [Cichorium endivia]|nr:hypothetical protein L1887_56474 [Cichorium endivia]
MESDEKGRRQGGCSQRPWVRESGRPIAIRKARFDRGRRSASTSPTLKMNKNAWKKEGKAVERSTERRAGANGLRTGMASLEDGALGLLADDRWLECRDDRLVKHVFQSLLRQRRALDVLDRAQLSRQALARLERHGTLLGSRQLLDHRVVVAQIHLRAYNQARHTGAVVVHLGEPLLLDVLERRWRGDREAHQEHVRLRVRQRSQSVVVLLTRGIEESQRVRVLADHHRHGVVVEHRGHVLGRELVGGVRDQQADAAASVARHWDGQICSICRGTSESRPHRNADKHWAINEDTSQDPPPSRPCRAIVDRHVAWPEDVQSLWQPTAVSACIHPSSDLRPSAKHGSSLCSMPPESASRGRFLPQMIDRFAIVPADRSSEECGWLRVPWIGGVTGFRGASCSDRSSVQVEAWGDGIGLCLAISNNAGETGCVRDCVMRSRCWTRMQVQRAAAAGGG